MSVNNLFNLPEQIKLAHHSLGPFVKQAQEVTHIRRILALYLSSRVNTKGASPISHPLSLLDPEYEVGSTSKGIRRDYLRCARANIEARQQYEKICKKHQISPESQNLKGGTRKGYDDYSLGSFLEVIKYRRKHERLRILQDYVDMLAQKPAAASDYLDPKVVLKDVDSLPPVPSDVMSSTGPRQESQRTDLKDLVEQLEKSVLRARLLLKREQKLLLKVRAEGASRNMTATSAGSRLQALGTARNELINWIETELAKAGDGPAESENQDFMFTEKKGKNDIDTQLSSIQRQYAQYTKARQALITSATGTMATPSPATTDNDLAPPNPKDEAEKANAMSHALHPYLEELASVSNQQKSMIQQKSHLTISLAKQLKEAGQGLDRLAEESHLLPSYPFPGSQRKEMSFAEKTSNYEKPDSSQKARAWVHASELASKATKDAVAQKLEEGEGAILDARRTLLDLQHLLGEDVNQGGSIILSSDIWTTLDGHLGAIERDGVDDV